MLLFNQKSLARRQRQKREARALPGKTSPRLLWELLPLGENLLAAWLCWHQRSAHAFENTTEIAVGGNDSCCVVLEGRARDVETAQEKVKVLRVGCAVGVGVNTRCLRVGLAFNL